MEFFTENKMTREEALKSYTLSNAYAAFEENEKGTLEVGKLADITILSKNFLTCTDEEILGTEVLYTIVGGKVMFKKE
jgi:predicted amidohydrolase YtcJ